MSGNYDEVNFNTTCPGTSCGTVTRKVFSGGDQALSGAFLQAIARANPAAPRRAQRARGQLAEQQRQVG
jgi:hypothetical protein